MNIARMLKMERMGVWVISFLLSGSFFICFSKNHIKETIDCVVVGFLNFADGIGRQAIGCIDTLVDDDITVTFIPSRVTAPLYKQDIPVTVSNLLKEQKYGKYNVAILEDLLTCGPFELYKHVPPATIRYAYSMVESTEVSTKWVAILNEHFDAVLVPDQFLVDIYKSSGVIIPIFVLPLGLYCDDMEYIELHPHVPFVFGFSGSFVQRKNHSVVLEAFAMTFGNNPDVKLILHGRDGNETYDAIEAFIRKHELTNVELIRCSLSWSEYKKLLTSFDCYVSVSLGEGYSLIPREVLAYGIPCILSDNTAQHSICETGFVYTVPSLRTSQAYYKHLDEVLGDFFECEVEDVAQALCEVYEHYDEWLKKAFKAREWACQFSYRRLKQRYRSVIKPSFVELGNCDVIEEDHVITTSEELFKKYQNILEHNKCRRTT